MKAFERPWNLSAHSQKVLIKMFRPSSGSATKNSGIFLPKKLLLRACKKWSGTFIPDPDFFPHPGSRGQKKHRIPESATLACRVNNHGNQCCCSGSGILDRVPFWPMDPGSGMGRKSASGSGIRDEQPGSYFLELRNHFFGFLGLKYLNSLMRSGIRDGDSSDPGSGMEKSRIRDPG